METRQIIVKIENDLFDNLSHITDLLITLDLL